MANLEKFSTYSVICDGGLDSNKNHISLSRDTPGAAINLVNFELSLFGGYRKISGFSPLEADYAEVDAAGSEGKILGIHILEEDIIVARKTQSASTYKFFYWSSGADWTAFTTGLTHTVTNVDKIRGTSFNFQGPDSAVVVDGVNPATLYNGTSWIDVGTGDTGADFANAGGNQALPAPKYATVFKNHVFVSGDSTNPQVVAHSAPNEEYKWTAAGGAGQLNVGFNVKQIKPFRDELYVFGLHKIKKIVVEGSTFVIKDVTEDMGLLASDSVIEVNGDLLFLAADGLRTIAATERNNDIEIGNQAKKIQQDLLDLISSADLNALNAVLVRKKSQVRYFFSDENLLVSNNVGILGAIHGGHEAEHTGTTWEWGKLKGIRTSCTASAYIGNQEYVLHGDYNGKVYRQEQGNNFDGADILAVYQTPYLDFSDPFIRKSIHKVSVFIRPEDAVNLSMSIKFDWGDREISVPNAYILESAITGDLYGTGVYGTAVYASTPAPVINKNIEGSSFSNSLTFTSNDSNGSFSIQAILYEYAVNGRK